jgi:hypothetical protein
MRQSLAGFLPPPAKYAVVGEAAIAVARAAAKAIARRAIAPLGADAVVMAAAIKER